MAKNILSDIRPSEKRSIRVIPVPEGRAAKSVTETSVDTHSAHPNHETHHESAESREPLMPPVSRSRYQPQPDRIPQRDYSEFNDQGGNHDKKRAIILWSLVGLCILILIGAVATFFSGATVTVAPKTEAVEVDLTLAASKSGNSGDLPYQLITLSEQVTKTIPANGEKTVETKASGKIILYNNFSSATQRLIKNTRFETPDGLIYRTQEAVVIPGKKGTVPGSVEITVYADIPGEKYNIGLVDFTIPGFKTSPDRYKEIYGRSKTPMTGGMKGTVPVVKDSDAKAARDSANEELKNRLLTSAKSQTPDHFIFFDNTSVMNFEELPNQAKSDGTALLTQKGTLTALIVEEGAFAAAVASKTLEDYDAKPVLMPDATSLNVTLRDVAVDVLSKELVYLRVKGSGTLVWQYDEEVLKESLKGQRVSQYSQILKAFPEITPVKAVVRPFWNKSFPDKTSKITIKVAK